MPNHVRNIVKMKGITALPVFTEKESWDKKMVMSLDFEKIIPMPESLNVVSGTLEMMAVEAAVRKAVAASHSAPSSFPACRMLSTRSGSIIVTKQKMSFAGWAHSTSRT